jgi:phage nucleotide-binding protein
MTAKTAATAQAAPVEEPKPNEFGIIIRKPTKDPKAAKIKMNIFGKSGTGKTRLALQLAKHWKTFLIFSERSETSIISHPDYDTFKDNLEFTEVSSWEDVKKTFDYIVSNQHLYDWVVIDSLTDVNKRVIEDINASSKEEVMSQRQWGQVTIRMERLIRYIRDLKTNILFVCLATGDKNDMTGEICMYPSMTGKLKEELPAYLDINGYMYTIESKEEPGKVERCIQFTNSPRAIAKDRFDKLTYEYADMDKIMQKLGRIE